jgi:hypothetical protein
MAAPAATPAAAVPTTTPAAALATVPIRLPFDRDAFERDAFERDAVVRDAPPERERDDEVVLRGLVVERFRAALADRLAPFELVRLLEVAVDALRDLVLPLRDLVVVAMNPSMEWGTCLAYPSHGRPSPLSGFSTVAELPKTDQWTTPRPRWD